jgi:hypothetical protein
MTVRVYRSTDASAPVLTGQVGSLTALLDAVLVNGYGALSAAGWTINQTTTNKRGYKQNLTGANNSSGMLLYVDDTGPGAGAAREARVCGFETMSAITPTGTGQFPTSGQSAIGVGTVVIRKSNTADATARAWTIIANGQTIYLFIESGDFTAPLAALAFMFGDFKSYKTSDQYAVMIIGRQGENTTAVQNEAFQQIGGAPTGAMTLNNKMFGHYVARSWTGLGGSVNVGKTVDYGKVSPNPSNLILQQRTDVQTALVDTNINFCFGRNASSAQLQTPNGPDGALWLSPVYIFHNYAIRGYMSGLWCPLQDRPLVHNDTITVASGTLNGKSMIAQQIPAFILNAIDIAIPLIEYSDTWT